MVSADPEVRENFCLLHPLYELWQGPLSKAFVPYSYGGDRFIKSPHKDSRGILVVGKP
jgi:hypothetical protein